MQNKQEKKSTDHDPFRGGNFFKPGSFFVLLVESVVLLIFLFLFHELPPVYKGLWPSYYGEKNVMDDNILHHIIIFKLLIILVV